jgi:transcriptional regulator with XRE-family HTH domain
MEVLETINKVFALNLRNLRGDRNQEEIAELAKVPTRTYQRYEAGVLPKRRQITARLARALKVPESRLFLDPDAMPKVTPAQAVDVILRYIKDTTLSDDARELVRLFGELGELDKDAANGLLERLRMDVADLAKSRKAVK